MSEHPLSASEYRGPKTAMRAQLGKTGRARTVLTASSPPQIIAAINVPCHRFMKPIDSIAWKRNKGQSEMKARLRYRPLRDMPRAGRYAPADPMELGSSSHCHRANRKRLTAHPVNRHFPTVQCPTIPTGFMKRGVSHRVFRGRRRNPKHPGRNGTTKIRL